MFDSITPKKYAHKERLKNESDTFLWPSICVSKCGGYSISKVVDLTTGTKFLNQDCVSKVQWDFIILRERIYSPFLLAVTVH